MRHPLTPKKKLVLLLAAFAVLALVVIGQRVRAPGETLVVIGLAAAGLVWSVGRRPSVRPAPEPLEVRARAALSGGCHAALLRTDSRTFLVVHGQGFAQVCETFDDRPEPFLDAELAALHACATMRKDFAS